MPELDVIWMACLVFIPLIGGFVALACPSRWPDLGAWVTTMVAVATLGTAIAILIQFKYDTLDQLGVLNDMEFRHKGSLAYRSAVADIADDHQVRSSIDWVARNRWAGAWGLDLLWAIDGAAMACILCITFAILASSVAGWRPSSHPGVWRFCLLALESSLLAACVWQNLAVLAGLSCLATVLASQLARISGMAAGMVMRFEISGYSATVALLLAAVVLRGIDCHDHAPPDRLDQLAWQQVRSKPEVRHHEAYHSLPYHTFDLTVLARVARAAWHGREVEALTLERWRAKVDLAKFRGMAKPSETVEMEQFISDEASGFERRQKLLKSGSALTVSAIFLILAACLLLNVWPAPMAWSDDSNESPAARMVLSIFGVLGLVVLFQAAWPMIPGVLAAGGALSGWGPWIPLGGLIGSLVVLSGARSVSTLVGSVGCAMSSIAISSTISWPGSGKPEDMAWALNGGLFIGLAAVLGSVFAWSVVSVVGKGRGAPAGMLRLLTLVQCGLPGTLGFVGLVLGLVALERASMTMALLAGFGILLIVLLSRRQAGRVGLNEAFMEWNPRAVAVVGLGLLPLMVPGVAPILLTSWCEPAMTARAEWLLDLPEAAPGQGRPLPKAATQ